MDRGDDAYDEKHNTKKNIPREVVPERKFEEQSY